MNRIQLCVQISSCIYGHEYLLKKRFSIIQEYYYSAPPLMYQCVCEEDLIFCTLSTLQKCLIKAFFMQNNSKRYIQRKHYNIVGSKQEKKIYIEKSGRRKFFLNRRSLVVTHKLLTLYDVEDVIVPLIFLTHYQAFIDNKSCKFFCIVHTSSYNNNKKQ